MNEQFYRNLFEDYQLDWLEKTLTDNNTILDDPDLFNEKYDKEWNYWQRQTICQFYTGLTGKTILEEMLYSENVQDCPYLSAHTDIKNAVIPSTYTYVPKLCFAMCRSLDSATISEGVQTVNQSAFWKSTLKSVKFPKSLKHIETSAFHSTELESVTIPGTVERIGNAAFAYNVKLKSIKIEDGLEVIPVSFCELTAVEDVKLPSSCRIIKEKAFNGCSHLKSIEIPDGVKEIGDMAFMCCPNLTVIEFPKTITWLGKYLVGSWSANQYTGGKCKFKIKGMSKAEAREWAQLHFRFPTESARETFIRKLI